MTTIAANRRCMAADRLVHSDEGRTEERKIFRVGDAIIGLCGSTAATEKALPAEEPAVGGSGSSSRRS